MICGQRPHYITGALKGETMNLHNDAVLAYILVKFTSRN